jgi:heat-inducible transcriptional repressor
MDNIFEIPEFQDVRRLRDIVQSIERSQISHQLRRPQTGLEVTIGNQNNIGLDDCTIISIPYQIGENDGGTIAIIGPKRMEYKKAIPLLEYLAKNMTKLFDDE